jgi:hypothetical protein
MDGTVDEEKDGCRERGTVRKKSSSTLVRAHDPGLDLRYGKVCYAVRSVVHTSLTNE